MADINVRTLVLEVLESGYLLSLATMDEGGVWVADVIYVCDDNLNIYWMSSPSVRHSRAIVQNNKVAGTITISNPGEDNSGIQCEGIAEKIEGPRYDLAKKHFAKRGKPEPSEGDDVLNGRSWYVLRPTMIELIHEQLFGFKKQMIEL